MFHLLANNNLSSDKESHIVEGSFTSRIFTAIIYQLH